jgi:hypothetical protein
VVVLFVGVFTPHSTNVAQARGFLKAGCSVYEYDYRDRAKSLGDSRRDDDLISTVKQTQPDIVVFSKCNQMHYRVIDECNKYSKTILWYMDAMNNFDQELIEKIKRVNWFINGIEGVVPHGMEYNKNTVFLAQCPDEEMNFPLSIECKYDTTFIGNIQPNNTHSDRMQYFEEVGFNHFDNVHGLEHNKVVNASKINLNFAHTSTNGASVRVFKILAAKSFLLTTPWDGMEEMFTVGKHLDIFTTPEELKDKISYYINNEAERLQICNRGHELVQKYMPTQWAKEIIKYVTQSI